MGAIFSSINWADTATLTVHSGTVTNPLAELQKPWGRGLMRGDLSGIAVIVFRVDLLEFRDVVSLGLIGMQGYCTVRFQLSAVADFSVLLTDESVVYDSSWGYPYGAGCWLHPPGATPWNARYLQVRVDVFEGAAMWVDARRLWIGGGVILPEGVNVGYEIDPAVDGSTTDRTPDGGVYVDERTRWRRITVGRTRMTRTQAIGVGGYGAFPVPGLAAHIARVGRSREVVIAARANAGEDNQLMRYFETVYGQLTSWRPVKSGRGNFVGIDSITAEEAPMPALS